MKPTQEQIEEARKRGIVPGARIRCASDCRDKATVPPHTSWQAFRDGGLGFTWEGVTLNRIYICNGGTSYATVITPAPQAEGLIDGMACEPDEFMRKVVLSKAVEVGLADGAGYRDKRLAYFTDCSVLQNADRGTHKPTTLIPAGEFYDRLCRMKKKPEPIIIHSEGKDHSAEFYTDGSIKVGCTVIDSETMDRIIEQRAKTKQP